MKSRKKTRGHMRRARLFRLENLQISRSPRFECLESRRLLSIAKQVTTAEGTTYTLTDAASGGWLEMQQAGANVTEVIDTNIARFDYDASGAAIALEDTGDLVMFPANSSLREVMLRSVRNFVVDGTRIVTALQAGQGSSFGTLYRFAPGTAEWQMYSGKVFSDLVAALGVSMALGSDNNLYYFPDNSTQAVAINGSSSVTNFVVDGDGSVVALERPSTSAPAGTLVRWRADGVPPTAINGSYQALALDDKGDVVALDAGDVAKHLGTVWFFSPGSDQPEQMGPPDSTFLIDASGAVWTFGQLTPNNWTAETFVAGSNTQKSIKLVPGGDVLFQQFELDGSGSMVALDVHGNLVRFVADGATNESEQLMDPSVTEFVVDGAGFVVARVSQPEGDALVQFAPGATAPGPTILRPVTSMALDATGSVVALAAAGDLESFAPGSTTGRLLDYANVWSFALDKYGRIVALENTGM